LTKKQIVAYFYYPMFLKLLIYYTL